MLKNKINDKMIIGSIRIINYNILQRGDIHGF